MAGQWETPVLTMPVGAVHMIHVYHASMGARGKILILAYGSQFPYSSPDALLWTPPVIGAGGSGTFESVPNSRTNLFCCGNCAMADGRILTSGGNFLPTGNPHLAPVNADRFDPSNSQWSALPNMAAGRWYPTCTTLGDGRILICSGISDDTFTVRNYIPELFAQGVFTQLPSATRQQTDYPFMFVLPSGDVFDAG